MARFLLIHGSAHGAWCWRDVIPALTALGHDVSALDLPSNGADPTPPENVTLDDYADAVIAALTRPAIVVGHSMGGYPISAAADRVPDRVQRLIYLCAYLPVPGVGLADMRRRAKRQPLLPAIVPMPDGKTMRFDPELVPDLLYNLCPPETITYALPRLSRQPIAPQDTPLALTGGFNRVPKSYVICDQDKAIPPEYQAEMASGLDPADVYHMDSSHSPFFADPSGLAELLDRIATTA